MPDLTVYAIGTQVRLAGAGCLDAVVTAIVIRADRHVSYECSWWHNNERKTDWFPRRDVKALDEYNTGKTIIGFKVN